MTNLGKSDESQAILSFDFWNEYRNYWWWELHSGHPQLKDIVKL